MQIRPEKKIRFIKAQSYAIGLAGAAVFVWLAVNTDQTGFSATPVSLLGVPVIALLAYFYFRLRTRRWRRRAKLTAQPFPPQWKETLNKCVPFYRNLDDSEKRRFENDVRIFIDEQNIYGERGAAVDDEVKVLIGASAAILGFGLPEWEWPNLRDIVVYPAAFNEDYETGEGEHILGMVHHSGPIIFSQRDLKHGFKDPKDGLNVGLHELAHVMDMADGAADGVPAGISWIAAAPWVKTVADRLLKLRSGCCRKILRSYAATDEAEFFAVAVEAFFENPARLYEQDNELYEMLSEYFNQDPVNRLKE